MLAFVSGVRSEDRRHLITAHVHPDESGIEQYGGADWLTLNQTYTYGIDHRKLAADYAREPTRPFVLFETTYEGEHNASELQIRRQAWWALTAGAAGSFFGNFPLWLMSPGWEATLNSPGSISMYHLGVFVRSLQWWNLVPDVDHSFLVAGIGEFNGLDCATAALAADGRAGLVYVPTGRTITIDLGRLSGWTIRARWYDPRTGNWQDAGTHTRRGFAQYTTPGAEDAVLVLVDPAAGNHGRWAGKR